jgi:CheY-like chemotaxis protein
VIADDDAPLRNLIASILTDRHLRTLVAADGVEALDLVRQEHPRLVLIDLVMPKLDGLAVCRAIKADPALADVKVVILTGHNDMPSIHEGRAAGPDLYLTKPFNLAQLRQAVDILLS